jgi:cytochrome c-type biogenesis protein CcmH/NrfF
MLLDADPVVSIQLWVYFAIAVPVTALIVGCWMYLDRRRREQHKKDDADLEKNIDKMEKEIMFALRKRTMSKANTWNTANPPPKP